ncbi:MAG TPA: MFS transporter [Vicinamibacterales bacterium]|nr:MFS transporter [Vicinamibacterales bacterium]
MSGPPAVHPSHHGHPAARRIQLLWLGLFRGTRSVAAGLIAIAFPYLVLQQGHYRAWQLGLIYTAAAVATAGLGLLVGFLADLWGKKRTLLLVGVLLPISSFIAWSQHSLVWLFVAAIVGGYSATGSLMGGGVGGAAQPIQSAVIASLAPADRRTLVFSLFAFLGGTLAACGALLARTMSVRAAFGAATLISLVGLLSLWPLALHETRGHLRRLPSMKIIGKFSVTGALNGFSQGLVMPFLIPFFVLVYHLPEARMATYAFAGGILASLALFAAPVLERRWGFVRAIGATRGVGAALILILPFWHRLAVALAIYVVTPALRVAALPAQQTAITELVGHEERGRALGLNQVTRLTASAGAVSLTGYSFSLGDFPVPFVLYAALIAVNIGLYFRFFGADGLNGRRPADGT